jgi:hypothetical protein
MTLKNKKGIRIFRLTVFYAVFTAVIMFIAIFFVNRSIVIDTSAVAETGNIQTIETAGNTMSQSSISSSLINVPSGTEYLSFSSDGQYCIYLLDGSLYIIDISTHKTIKQITDSNKITSAVIMYDRNIIIYFTIKPATGNNGTSLQDEISLNTYNIDADVKLAQKTFSVSAGAVIKQADYSSQTGEVYFNIKSDKNEQIYNFNLMKQLKKIFAGSQIVNMALANDSVTLYYEKNNMLYCHMQPVKALKNKKISLLGCDMNDNVYVRSLNDKKYVYVIKGVSIIKTILLSDTGFSKVYSNKTNIYLIYSDYFIKLSPNSIDKYAYEIGRASCRERVSERV